MYKIIKAKKIAGKKVKMKVETHETDNKPERRRIKNIMIIMTNSIHKPKPA